MNEHVDWQARKELDGAKAILLSRFPDFRCLRCKSDNFILRQHRDPSLVPAIASPESDRVIELICMSCGLQENHVVNLLSDEAPAKA